MSARPPDLGQTLMAAAPRSIAVTTLLLALGATTSCSADPVIPEAVHVISPTHLAVRLDDAVEPSRAASDWTLTSADVPGLEGGVQPIAATRKRWAAELIPIGWPYPSVPAYEIVLELAEALVPGATYTLRSDPLVFTWTHDPETTWTPTLKLNQVGFLPDAPSKFAHAGYWLADLASLTLTDARWRVLRESDGATMLQGDFVLHFARGATTDDAYGADYGRRNIYAADFSALVEPGTYFILWEGVGRSWSFELDPGLYDEPFRVAARGLYHQRCGTALPPSTTAWSHGACHLDPVRLTTADYHVVGADAFAELPPAATGEVVAATGGHHDAGDYDRRTEHLLIVQLAVDLYEIDPLRFGGELLNIPESGNGIPDLLDEAAWALGLYAQLQAAGGGIPAGVETTGYPEWGTLPEDDTGWTWYAYATDPISSYRFAAAAAKLSRALQTFDATAAASWLDRAERAWIWAEANPRPYGTGGFDVEAAAELFKTTSEPPYQQAFQDRGFFAGGNLGASLADWDANDPIQSLYTHATTLQADPDYRAACVRVITERAESWIRRAAGSGHLMTKHPYSPVGYGSLTTPRDAVLLFRAHHLTGDERFREYGLLTCDVVLGGNWSGRSWVTGLGDAPVRRPLSHHSIGDAIDEPVPGLTVYGPSRQESSSGILGAALAAYEPPVAEWPLAERFVDVSYVPIYNEYTVPESIAPTVFAFGYLARLAVADADGDGVPDADDCAPSDANHWAVPPPINELRVARSGADLELTWPDLAALAGPGVSHDVASDSLAALRAAGSASGPCVVTGLAENTHAWIAAGSEYVLVRARNACGEAEGAGWGLDSRGNDRGTCP